MRNKNKRNYWQGKNVLISGGPTAVAIDTVRIITNIATGKTACILANCLAATGAKVTLLLGDRQSQSPSLRKGIRLFRFFYFTQLRKLLLDSLGKNRYDVIIHSAAVSDFAPSKTYVGKLSSQKGLVLKLKPLPKLLSLIKKKAGRAKLVVFKLEVKTKRDELLNKAYALLRKYDAEMVIANTLNPYRAYIMNKERQIIPVPDKVTLAKKLRDYFNHRYS